MDKLKRLGKTMLIVLGIEASIMLIYIDMLSLYLLLFVCIFLFVYYIVTQLDDKEES